ncbi:MAG: aminoacyl-tRNA hydrolase [Candidatus Cloacimonadota bacterium]|nr:MAG: aminoacyl-tRNA hydrolase [Candidatus Cloacimonadota bacterium]
MIVIGLGNPGEKYDNTRHNIGFMTLDYLNKNNLGQDFQANKYNKSYESNLTLSNNNITLLKPQTFMNLSGESLIRLKKTIPPSKMIVIYDDFDLTLGSIRIRKKGSAGSHNGMKSIISILGTNEFPRIRIGIRPNHPIKGAASFVLGKFQSTEIEIINKLYPCIQESIELIINNKLEEACQKFNKKNLLD